MYREEKMSSRVCGKRWQERSYMLHRKKLSDIKPSIDNKTPQMYPHLYQKLKKAQKDEELCSVIERDNRTLVKRMTEIMQRPGIDTHNTQQPKSLNRESRKRELLRITQENQKLLRRIQARQPTYNHLQWEQERERNEVLCERICRYPYRPRTTAEKNLYYYESPTATGEQGHSGGAPPIDMSHSPNTTMSATQQSGMPNTTFNTTQQSGATPQQGNLQATQQSLNNTVTSQGSSRPDDSPQQQAAAEPTAAAASPAASPQEEPPVEAQPHAEAEEAAEETPAPAAPAPAAEEPVAEEQAPQEGQPQEGEQGGEAATEKAEGDDATAEPQAEPEAQPAEETPAVEGE